jgi:hypothetical protein
MFSIDSLEFDSQKRMKIYNECFFSGFGFNDNHEVGECSSALQIAKHCKNVLEIGGGTGKVSHVINKELKKTGKEYQHLVVEPYLPDMKDDRLRLVNPGLYYEKQDLRKNQRKFNDKYSITHKAAQELVIEDFDVLNGPPDCIISDCEGNLFFFQQTPAGKYALDNARFIINEMDGHDEYIREQWRKHGFEFIAMGYGCGTNCDTEFWSNSHEHPMGQERLQEILEESRVNK